MIRWFFALLFLAVAGFGMYFLLTPGYTENTLYSANEAYMLGMRAKTIFERKTQLNRALTYYSELEKENEPILGNGKLYQQIGNIYYELESYPFALLYYYRALALNPRNSEVVEAINRAREKLDIQDENGPSVFHDLFFFHHYYSLPKRLQLLLIFGVGAFILGSGAYWFKKKWMAYTSIVFTVFCALFTLSALHTRYFEPLEGVLIRATLLTKEVGEVEDWATEKPTTSGVKVEVLDVYEDGGWLKVVTPDGVLGFTTADRVRLI